MHLDLLAKLVVAVVLGGVVGLERELSGKPAGLRTNILICLGAALFMHLSISVAEAGFSSTGQPYGDTTRIAAQIVSGIGFLGAGAILHSRGAVVGLTTAATIWVVAAIGAAVGAGGYVEAVGTTVLVALVLVGLRPVERLVLSKRRTVSGTLRTPPGTEFREFEEAFRSAGVHVVSRVTFDHPEDRTFEITLVGATKQLDSLLDILHRREDVISIQLD
ncbi:MAG TPA: MgtC/SapB family protein [Gemmatimonadaceae bacterium]|nr:MgtC/SapB family protein [Gemmatimonadaceae bacterium]